MGLSAETLILAQKYARQVASKKSRQALEQAIETAVRESNLYSDRKFGELYSFNVMIVETLPSENISDHTLYFLKRYSPSGRTDYFYEYMYIEGVWELIGSTELDLSPYWTIEEVKNYVTEVAYHLPIASKTKLGGVRVDEETITVEAETGTISVIQDKAEEIAESSAQKMIDANFNRISSLEISNLF